MKSEKLIGVFGIVLFVGIAFALVISTANAYYQDEVDVWSDEWSDQEDINECEDDALGYYDYYTGQWREIPEPDPYCYPVSYGHSRSHRSFSPISTMMPLFIVFFVIFLPWLAYALGRGED